jgi:hypothetical protein
MEKFREIPGAKILKFFSDSRRNVEEDPPVDPSTTVSFTGRMTFQSGSAGIE